MSLKRKFNGTHPDRWQDPVAWDCLTDEHRHIINSWYKKICEDQRNEEKRREELSWYSSAFALIPFAVIWACSSKNSDFSFMTLINIGAAWLIHMFVFYVFRDIYERVNPEKSSALYQIIQVIIAIFASLCLAHLIYG